MTGKALSRSLVPLAVALLLIGSQTVALAWGGGGQTPHPSYSPGPPHRWSGGTDGLSCGKGRNRPGSPVDLVNTFTGNLTIQDIPVLYQSVGDPLPFVLTFNSQSARTGPLGDRWTHSYNAYIVDDAPYGAAVIEDNGWEHYFTFTDPDTYTAPPGVFDKLEKKYAGPTWDGWILTRPNRQMLWFDTLGRLKTVSDGSPLTWNFGYSDGRLVIAIDPLLRETILTYTGDLLTRVTVPGGLHADFQYDSYTPKRLWKITDASGDTYTFGYSGTRVTSITDPNGRQIWYQYGTYDTRTVLTGTGITGLSDSTVAFGYSAQPDNEFWADITDTKDSQSRVTRHVHAATGPIMGALTDAIVDVGGVAAAEAYMYDSDFRLTTYRDSYELESGGKDHVHHFYYYDGTNPSRVTKYIDPENWTGSPASPSYGFLYDTLGNLTKITTPQSRVTDFTYFSGTDRLASIIIRDEDINGNPYDHTTSFTYWTQDDGYRLKTVTDARSNTTTFYYDGNGYLDYIDPPLGANWYFDANSVGDITSVTDGNGNTTSFSYDGLHRLTQITYPDVGAGQKSRYFDWLPCGLEYITDENGRITKFEYDLDTKWVHKVIEDYGGLNYQTTYAYDEVGNPVAVTNARGKTREYTWDGAERLTGIDYPDGTYETWTLRDDGRVYQHRDGRNRITTYRYDADDRLAGSGSYVAINYPNDTDVQIARDADGLVTGFTDGTGTTSIDYYPSTWVKSVTDGYSKTVTCQYDGVGNVTTLTIPYSYDFTYAYNANNQLASVSNEWSATWSLTYDSGGRLSRVDRPGGYTSWAYNARDWITSVKSRDGSENLQYDAYYWYSQQGTRTDHTGSPLKIHEYFDGTGYWRTQNAFDAVHRQTAAARYWIDSQVTTESVLVYEYDGVGNRTRRQETVAGADDYYTYDDNDKLTKIGTTSGGNDLATFGYDDAGNMTSASGDRFGSWTMVYDDDSRLTSVTYPSGEGSQTDAYWYNALGQRKRALYDSLAYRYIYFGEREVSMQNDSGSSIAITTNAGPSYFSPMLGRRWGAVNRYPLYDAMGTARRMVRSTGELEFTYQTDSFGHYLSEPGNTVVNPYRYGGAWGYMTDPSGLLQLGARFYWPELGRFIQQDPIGHGINWYVYARNNPLRLIDPEGLGLLDTVRKPFEALGAWIGDTIWPDKSDPHPCSPGTTGPQDYAGAGGAALAIGGLATALAGHGATVIGDAAAKASYSSGFWTTAGTVAKAAGYGAALGGGIVTFYETADKAISGAGKPAHEFRHTGGHGGLANDRTLEDDLQEDLDEIWPGYHRIVPEGP